ncbi:MAG: T9SS type A sorting domain-containing protein [Candidatus Kapabacteria bacterium]|nr:T9SS type A sorting domain-containing protein [Candidatus Kapabacteria bacterium]
MKKLLLLIVLLFSYWLPAYSQNLKLTQPNGTEKFVVGTNEDITWEGISAQDTVSLDYSIDNGVNWNIITNSATGLKYTWTNIPKPVSDKCLIKIKQNRFSKVNMDSIKTLLGHTSNVSSVDISQDGNIIVTGSSDNTAKIWDVVTGKEIHSLTGHTSWLNSVAISQDGSKIVTGSGDNTAKIWDVNTGKVIRTLIGHSDHVYGVAISVEGNKIVTGSRDKTAKIWDANTGKVINTFTGHFSCVNSVAISQDGSKIVTGSYDKTVKIWDANTGNEIRTLTGHKNLVYSVSISQDGTKIITGSYDKTAKIWYANTGNEIRTLTGHTDYVTSVTLSQDGKKIVTGSNDNTAKIWNINTGEEILTLAGHKSSVNCIAISKDGIKIVTGSLDKTAKIWDSKFFISEVDTSDILFSIVAPSPKGIDIDMKKCLVNKSKDSIIVDCLVNNGNYKFTTDSVFISGADAKTFQVINLITPFNLDFAQTKNIEFRFIPNRVGLHSAKVNIITQSDTLVYNIIGEGISNKDTAKLTFKINRMEANTGVVIKIPIILENAISLSTSSITSLQTDLIFNSSMLYPMDFKSDSIGLNLGKITITNMPANKKSGDTLALVRFIPALGNAQECDLVLANPIASGGDADFTLVNGSFKLLDVCYDGGARFLNGTKQSSLFAIYPNPANDNIEIEYSNADNGLAEFKLINVLGEVVSSIQLEKVQNGKAKMNLKDLPSGQYFGVFNTESINQNMIISVIR